MNICRTRATWSTVGTMVHKLPPRHYRVPIQPDEDMIEVLGIVKPRSDGRWDWWRLASVWQKDWQKDRMPGATNQGVTHTEDMAMNHVLCGWGDDYMNPRPVLFQVGDQWQSGTLLRWCANGPYGEVRDNDGVLYQIYVEKIKLDSIKNTFRPRIFNIECTWIAVQTHSNAINLFRGVLENIGLCPSVEPMIYRGRVVWQDGDVVVADGEASALPIRACYTIFKKGK